MQVQFDSKAFSVADTDAPEEVWRDSELTLSEVKAGRESSFLGASSLSQRSSLSSDIFSHRSASFWLGFEFGLEFFLRCFSLVRLLGNVNVFTSREYFPVTSPSGLHHPLW